PRWGLAIALLAMLGAGCSADRVPGQAATGLSSVIDTEVIDTDSPECHPTDEGVNPDCVPEPFRSEEELVVEPIDDDELSVEHCLELVDAYYEALRDDLPDPAQQTEEQVHDIEMCLTGATPTEGDHAEL